MRNNYILKRGVGFFRNKVLGNMNCEDDYCVVGGGGVYIVEEYCNIVAEATEEVVGGAEEAVGGALCGCWGWVISFCRDLACRDPLQKILLKLSM